MVVPLHVKSHYSLGYGTASVEELADRAAQDGLPALALTDIENLYGQIRFHHACRRLGIRPLTGVELRAGFGGRERPGERRGRLVLLARDRVGYESLCRTVSRRRAGPSSGPGGSLGDPVESLPHDLRGLLVLSDHAATLERLVCGGAQPASLGLLVVRPSSSARPRGPDESAAIELARRHGIRLLADPDVVMLDPADHPLHLLQVAVARKETLASVRRSGVAEPPERSFPDEAQARLFGDVPEAVAETRRLAEVCDLDLRSAPPVLPGPALPPGRDPDQHLADTCRARLERGRAAGGLKGRRYERRLENELATIRVLGLASYFLAASEIVDAARRKEIELAGRGSAAGSLVVYLLGATRVDPVERGLLFERFLHRRRSEVPDIDLDVASSRRDELLDWIFRRYGAERVAMVSAHGTFRRRSAYREGLKALGMPLAEVERVCRRIPVDEEPEAASPALPALRGRYREAQVLLERLIGRPQYVSVHPGGVVIADRAIDAHVPLERAPKGVVVAQYDMRSIQHAGLVKIDLLGNHFLSELQETLGLLRDPGRGQADGRCRPGPTDRGGDADRQPAPTSAAEALRAQGLAAIPEDDPRTLDTLDLADTIGCFQFESPAMRSLLRQIPIRQLSDCVAALALVRPGAASGHAKRAFVRRARGEEAIDSLHPALERRLRESHGILLYEEDVLCTLGVLAGIPLDEADELRSAIVEHGDEPHEMARLGARFLRLAADNGVDAVDAGRAWRRVLEFAAYSFSKAHAASYALLGYQAAYMRTHVPLQFGCAVLNHHGGMYPRRTIASAVARWGVELRPPSVNASEGRCTVELASAGSRQEVAGVPGDGPPPGASGSDWRESSSSRGRRCGRCSGAGPRPERSATWRICWSAFRSRGARSRPSCSRAPATSCRHSPGKGIRSRSRRSWKPCAGLGRRVQPPDSPTSRSACRPLPIRGAWRPTGLSSASGTSSRSSRCTCRFIRCASYARRRSAMDVSRRRKPPDVRATRCAWLGSWRRAVAWQRATEE